MKILMLLLLTFSVYGQSIITKIDIQPTIIQDTFLIEQIERYIDKEKNRDSSYFGKRLGYVTVYTKASGFWQDTILKYTINVNYYSLTKDDKDDLYPMYYSYIKNRLVFIHIDGIEETPKFMRYEYTKCSKRRFRKELEPFLEPTEKIKGFITSEGKKVNIKKFRGDRIRIHGGWDLYYVNPSKGGKPYVVYSKH